MTADEVLDIARRGKPHIRYTKNARGNAIAAWYNDRWIMCAGQLPGTNGEWVSIGNLFINDKPIVDDWIDDESAQAPNLQPQTDHMVIRADCHSDDRCVEVEFDAEKWFEAAPDDAVISLYECGWSGDYPADAVALAAASWNPQVASMFNYIQSRWNFEHLGFECRVNEDDAMRWLTQNRPDLAKHIKHLESAKTATEV